MMMSSGLLVVAVLAFTASADNLIRQPIGKVAQFLTTPLGLGEPVQYFDVALDLNDDKTLVMDVASANPQIDFYYDYIKNLFTPQASSTANVSGNVCRRRYFADDSTYNRPVTAYGVWADDIVTLGESTIEKNVRFCDVNTTRNSPSQGQDTLQWLMKLPVDGILGMKPGGENLLERLGSATSKLSIFYDQNAKEIDNVGEIAFGGEDHKNCDTFIKFPSADSDSWRLWVEAYSFSTYKNQELTWSMRLDLRNNTFAVPSELYSRIVNYAGGTTTIPCYKADSIPDLDLTIHGQRLKVPLKEAVVRYSSTQCRLLILATGPNEEDEIVLPRHVLDKYCLYLDFEESVIGFADKKN